MTDKKKTASPEEGLSPMKEGSPLGVRDEAVAADGSFVPHFEGVIGEVDAGAAKSSNKTDKK